MNENKKISGKTVIIIIGIIATIFLVIIPLYREYNLKKYCIYYAQHMPHAQGTDPVLYMVANNLDWVNEPDVPEGQRYTYDRDGFTTINIEEKNEKGEWEQRVIFGGSGSVYLRFLNSEKVETGYSFNERGELELITNERGSRMEEYTEEEKVKAYQDAYSIIQPYIDCQFFQLINLQGEFNRRYQSQFD